MNAFVTGSRVYGTPHEESDVDLCVLVDGSVTCEYILCENKDNPDEFPVRYGKLNLLIFTDEKRFEKWMKVTEELIDLSPVTREQAVAAFQAAGFNNYGEAPKELV